MLTVWCVYWGDKYAADYVYTLKRMVEAHLSYEHVFVCVTDAYLPGVLCMKPSHPEWKGWWQKINLFRSGIATGPSLYLDLDVVITGMLDDLVEEYCGCDLAMPANWAQSGHGGCQSSVMLWRGNTCWDIYERFDYERDSKRLWGDQEFITELLGDPGKGNVTAIDPSLVVSYKYHCRTGKPEDARVVVFHGKPDPHEVGDAWVKNARSRFTPISDLNINGTGRIQ
jgi:hypothetical protein